MVHKAGKKKQPPSVDTDTDGITEDEGEPSLWGMMPTMGTMLPTSTLTTRMEGLEMKQETQDDTATSHMVYTAQPEVSTSQAATSSPLARHTLAELDACPDVTENVRAQVAQCLREAPAPYPLTDEGPSSGVDGGL